MATQIAPKAMKNLKSEKLYFRVYEQLREYIAVNQLTAGDKLPTESEMCVAMGVSRNVLREAIKTLEITGIVQSKPGVGIVVQEFNTDFLFKSLFLNLVSDSQRFEKQTLQVRKVLELGFMEQAYQTLTPESIAQLEAQMVIMETISQKLQQEKHSHTSFGEEFAQADADFHKILYQNVDNDILSSIIDAVWACDRNQKCVVQMSGFLNTVHKHQVVLQAIKNQNKEEFIAAMHYHFNVAYKPDLP